MDFVDSVATVDCVSLGLKFQLGIEFQISDITKSAKPFFEN